jgi:hypothetical protein
MKSHDGAIINGIFYGINTKTPEGVYIYICIVTPQQIENHLNPIGVYYGSIFCKVARRTIL